MKNGRNGAITAAIACVLSAPLVVAPYAAQADELSDLRANQELLQHRLDQLARRGWADGSLPSLRWILVHMIEEYARHNGHADLLRQRIDGATGD